MDLVVFYRAVFQGKERPIATGPDILAGVELGAALANKDVSGDGRLSTEHLDTQSL